MVWSAVINFNPTNKKIKCQLAKCLSQVNYTKSINSRYHWKTPINSSADIIIKLKHDAIKLKIELDLELE
jgi:hypothetical protein